MHELRIKYAGFGVTRLLNAVYFANSTGEFSPPTICTSTHTNVVDCTVRYMQEFKHDRKLSNPLPRSWIRQPTVLHGDDLVEISASDIHFFDGDSAVVTIDKYPQLRALLRPNEKTLSIRLPHHDAPETSYAVRIYKAPQETDGVSKTPFLTRDIGMCKFAMSCIRS